MAAQKSISDPVHGTIQLSDLEARVISTRAFQRLRNVKQLGLAYMVFPGADYSRFSHSVGVCHVTQRILAAVKANGTTFDADEEQLYRLAGLLHDVGHYPFSHAMEEAIGNHYSELLTTAAPPAGTTEDAERWLDHESVGKEVLRENAEVRGTIEAGGFSPESIYRIFARETPPRFANLISSDLDADRIDYLLRTARHTGLPYGSVDLDYLLGQMRVDGASHVCIHPKALRTADHFLLGRYFDYQQVAFHKTVAALEWVLKDVIGALLREQLLECSAKDVRGRIGSDGWEAFDDTHLLGLIRALAASTKDAEARLKAQSILHRRPPKLVGQVEYLDTRKKETAKGVKAQAKVINQSIAGWAAEFDIPSKLWHVWEGGLTFTKVGSNVPISALAADSAYGAPDSDKTEQAIRVWDPRTNKSEPIMADHRSLMSVLSDRALYALRLYVLLPPGREGDRGKIAEKVRADLLNDVRWL